MEAGPWVPYTTLVLAAVGATASLVALCLPYLRLRREAAETRSARLPRPNVVLNFNDISNRKRHATVRFSPAPDGSVCHLATAEVIHPRGMEIRLKDQLASNVGRSGILALRTALIVGPNSPNETLSVTIPLDHDVDDSILVRFNGHRVSATPSEVQVDVELPPPVHSLI